MMLRRVRKLYRLLRGTERCCEDSGGKPVVGFAPWWPGTFYQARLAQELQERGFAVRPNELSLKSLLCLLLGRDVFDAVHVHWPHGCYIDNHWRIPLVLLHLGLYRLFKNNVIWTVHELEFNETRYPVFDRWVVFALLRFARALIVHSEYSVNVVRSRFDYQRDIWVLRHPSYIGCYPNHMGRDEARRDLKLAAEAMVYVFIGNVKPYKGVEALIQTFRSIEDPQLRLVIAGKPADERIERHIESLARGDSRITTHIHVIPDERLQVFLNSADAVILPFRKIHTSGSVILGMSFARAVIVPALASLTEEVDEKSGIFFNPNDPRGLRAAILRSRQKDLALMGRYARARVASRTWSDFADEHARLYRSLIASSERLKSMSQVCEPDEYANRLARR